MQPVHAIGFWPGLPRLWYRGDTAALAMAILFGLALNMALVATFAWPDWLSPWSVRMLWVTLLLVSPVAAVRNYLAWPSIQHPIVPSVDRDAMFTEAQTSYLRGDYFEAEAALHGVFAGGKQDIESAILMVSILRRTRRLAQAMYCIDRLLLLDSAATWTYELKLERQRIEKEMSEANPQPKLTQATESPAAPVGG